MIRRCYDCRLELRANPRKQTAWPVLKHADQVIHWVCGYCFKKNYEPWLHQQVGTNH